MQIAENPLSRTISESNCGRKAGRWPQRRRGHFNLLRAPAILSRAACAGRSRDQRKEHITRLFSKMIADDFSTSQIDR
jgi:hypothetical protein